MVRAPNFATQSRHSASIPEGSTPASGVKSHIAPRKRDTSACAAPPDSLPAIGWPGRKRARAGLVVELRAQAAICVLVLPTSVTSVRSLSTGASRCIQSRMASTGPASRMRSAFAASLAAGLAAPSDRWRPSSARSPALLRSVLCRRCRHESRRRAAPGRPMLRSVRCRR